MRMLPRIFIVIAFGLLTTIFVAWGFAAWRTVPMYARTPTGAPSRPIAHAFVYRDEPWGVNGLRGLGYQDMWWMNLHVESPDAKSQHLVHAVIARHTGVAPQTKYELLPPTWGSFAENRPISEVIGSDTAFGWPLPCLWYQVRGGLNGNATTASELHGGIHLRGEVDTRGRDFHALPLRPIWPSLLTNTGLFSLAWFMVLFGPGILRRALRHRRGACIACGYDLRHEFDLGCPECGWNRAALS